MRGLWRSLDRADFLSILFCLLIAAAVIYLFKLDRDPSNPFKLVQLISTEAGKADKYSIAYIGAFMVSTWMMWYLTVHDRLSEWAFGGYITAFVVGGVWKSSIASKERIAEMQIGAPTQPTQEVKTELKATTTTTSPRVEG